MLELWNSLAMGDPLDKVFAPYGATPEPRPAAELADESGPKAAAATVDVESFYWVE